MIEEIGTVVSVNGDRAEVEILRKTSCGGCQSASTCGTSVLAKYFGRRATHLSVDNPVGAATGDRVVLGMPEASLSIASFLLYIVPLATMIFSALAGDQLFSRFSDTSTEPAAIVCGLLGLLAGLKWTSSYTRQFNSNKNYQVVILRRAEGVDVKFD